jgi:hypothetical protein
MFNRIFTKNKTRQDGQKLVVLYASSRPEQEVVRLLSQNSDIQLQEAFTDSGLLRGINGSHLVVLDDERIPSDGMDEGYVNQVLDSSGIVAVSSKEFKSDPDDWVSRARRAVSKRITYRPPRNLNLVSYSGGVGRTTLALSAAASFVESTGMSAAVFELAPMNSALRARVASAAATFYGLVRGGAKAATWQGVTLLPVPAGDVNMLLEREGGQAGILEFVASIRTRHTLVVVDGQPNHPMWPFVASLDEHRTHTFVVTDPREEAWVNAHDLYKEFGSDGRNVYLVLNKVRSAVDTVALEPQPDVLVRYHQVRAQNLDHSIALPVLTKVYPDWRRA